MTGGMTASKRTPVGYQGLVKQDKFVRIINELNIVMSKD
jgi:hypothetical protein